MRLPGFTGEFSAQVWPHILRHSQELASCQGRGASMEPSNRAVTAALRDPNQECFAECRREGGSNCAELCRRGPKLGGSSTGTGSESVQCQIEEATHPIGTIALDAAVRGLKDIGAIKTKDECYTAIKVPAAIGGAAAGASAGGLGKIVSGIIGAAAGTNLDILGKCICNRYF
jgi:hypothetical protein